MSNSMNSLKEYGDLFERLALTELSVEEGDFKLCLKRKNAAPKAITFPDEIKPVPVAVAAPEAENSPKIEGEAVKAPLLGIFYGKVGDKEALEVGNRVKKGDVLCAIEAMKMINEVKAPIDGTITAVLAKEGDLVEYNQDLFIISQ